MLSSVHRSHPWFIGPTDRGPRIIFLCFLNTFLKHYLNSFERLLTDKVVGLWRLPLVKNNLAL